MEVVVCDWAPSKNLHGHRSCKRGLGTWITWLGFSFLCQRAPREAKLSVGILPSNRSDIQIFAASCLVTSHIPLRTSQCQMIGLRPSSRSLDMPRIRNCPAHSNALENFWGTCLAPFVWAPRYLPWQSSKPPTIARTLQSLHPNSNPKRA